MSKHLYKLLAISIVVFCYACGNGAINGQFASSEASCRYVDVNSLPKNVQLDVPFVKQDVNYCGPASLSMAMAYYGKIVDQHQIGDGIVNNDGTSAADLVTRARDYNFNSGMANCDLNNLLGLLFEGRPVIVRILNDLGDSGHFIVVTGYDIDQELVYLNDPDKPDRKSENFDNFQTLWNIKTLGNNNSENLMILIYPNITELNL